MLFYLGLVILTSISIVSGGIKQEFTEICLVNPEHIKIPALYQKCIDLHHPERPAKIGSFFGQGEEDFTRNLFFKTAANLWKVYKAAKECHNRLASPKWCYEMDEDSVGLEDFDAYRDDFANRTWTYLDAIDPDTDLFDHCYNYHQFGTSNNRYASCNGISYNLDMHHTDPIRDHVVRTRYSAWRDHWTAIFTKMGRNMKPTDDDLIEHECLECLHWYDWPRFYGNLSLLEDDSNRFERDCLILGYPRPLTWVIHRLFFGEDGQSGWASKSLISPRLFGLIRSRFQEKLKSYLLYDCLKYHRNEQMDWCRGLTWKLDFDGTKVAVFHEDYLETMKRIENEERKKAAKVDAALNNLYIVQLAQWVERLCNLPAQKRPNTIKTQNCTNLLKQFS